ncbi:hypothetical protein DL93DRAFT_343716 [Clavulina sp. PMI_390]|nr:hypothetical protein DL93DRAFT_343716 [Clavulina sp. PMI_390]
MLHATARSPIASPSSGLSSAPIPLQTVSLVHESLNLLDEDSKVPLSSEDDASVRTPTNTVEADGYFALPRAPLLGYDAHDAHGFSSNLDSPTTPTVKNISARPLFPSDRVFSPGAISPILTPRASCAHPAFVRALTHNSATSCAFTSPLARRQCSPCPPDMASRGDEKDGEIHEEVDGSVGASSHSRLKDAPANETLLEDPTPDDISGPTSTPTAPLHNAGPGKDVPTQRRRILVYKPRVGSKSSLLGDARARVKRITLPNPDKATLGTIRKDTPPVLKNEKRNEYF